MDDIDSINHVGMAVRDLDETARRYEAMGFQLTPYSPHSGSDKPGGAVQPFASGNRCVMFEANYLEILAGENPRKPAPRIQAFLDHHEGAQIICFNSDALEQVDARLVEAGVATSGLLTLQREIDGPSGRATAKFARVQFAPDDSPEGYIQAARHDTPHLIYQPQYIHHRNECYELSDAMVIALDFAGFVRKYEAYTGIAARVEGQVARFAFPRLSSLTIVDAGAASSLLPGTLFPPLPGIAAVTFRTRDMAKVRQAIERSGTVAVKHGDLLIVPAERASGVAVIFEQGA